MKLPACDRPKSPHEMEVRVLFVSAYLFISCKKKKKKRSGRAGTFKVSNRVTFQT